MAACTSRAAASTFRFKSNCSTMLLAPSVLVDVISVTPAIRPNWRSRGVATEEATVSGLAPGRTACTAMTGNSTEGREATGRKRYASAPTSSSAMLSSEVATGRLMKGAEMFTRTCPRSFDDVVHGERAAGRRTADAAGEAVECEVDDGGGVERQDLREEQSADDRDAERPSQLGAGART